jgi:hypothetical protein
LSGDNQFALRQVAAFNYFRLSAIAETHLDATRLWFAVLAHNPNYARLTWQHRCARRSKVALPACLPSCLLVSGLARRRGLLTWAGGGGGAIRLLSTLTSLPTLTTCLVVGVSTASANSLTRSVRRRKTKRRVRDLKHVISLINRNR